MDDSNRASGTRGFVATASLLLCGCLANLGPGSAGTETDGSSTGATGLPGSGPSDPGTDSAGSLSGMTSVASVTTMTETTSGSTQDTSSGSATVDSNSSSSSGSGLPVCGDEGTRRTAAIELGPNLSDTKAWENVDASCLVSSFERGGGSSEYTLECDEGGAEPAVRLLSAPYISALGVGVTVRLRYLRQYVIDGGFHWAFAIHDLEGALVMGNYRNNLPGDAPTDPATFFAPFEFDSVDGLCAPGPPPDDEGGGSFIVDPCPFIRTPLGVSVASGDRAITILDGTAGSFAGYEFNIFAGLAEYVDEGCGEDRESVSVYVYVFSEQN